MAKKKEALEKYLVYTDGSALGNPGPGGYGAIILKPGLNEELISLSSGFKFTTNNRMEMWAVLATLQHFPHRVELVIHSDSQYTIKGCESWRKGWRRNNWMTYLDTVVKNADLWKQLDVELNRHKVTFVKVKAHSGIFWNEKVDVLAKSAAANPTQYDVGFMTP